MQDASTIQQAIENMQQRLQQQELLVQQQQAILQRQNEYLAEQHQRKQAMEGGELHPNVADAIPPHLQCEPMEREQRKRLLKPYPKLKQMPKPIKDRNGLGARAIATKEDKKWIVNHLPALQRDALDVARVSLAAWNSYLRTGSNEQLLEAIRNVTALATDNAQRIAQLQLQQTFEASGAKGAYSIMQLTPDSSELDFSEHTLFQQAHIEALQDLKKYTYTIDQAKKNDKPKDNGHKQRSNSRYEAGRSFRDRDDRHRGGRNNYGNRPNYHRDRYGGNRDQNDNRRNNNNDK